MPSRTPRACFGFQLIEILIVLIIIMILAAMSIPVYSQFIFYERRQEAAYALTKLALALEHFHLTHHTYQGASWNELKMSPKTLSQQYQLAIELADTAEYVLVATPEDKQTADTECGALRLDNFGNKSISGSGTVADCW